MNLPEIMKRLLGISAVTISLLLGWSCAYWLTSMLYGAIHYLPHEFARQLINSVLGFFMFGIGMYFITRIRWVKSKQDKFLHPMIQAMKMMAEGNFDIDLSYYQNQFRGSKDHPYFKIIESINHDRHQAHRTSVPRRA